MNMCFQSRAASSRAAGSRALVGDDEKWRHHQSPIVMTALRTCSVLVKTHRSRTYVVFGTRSRPLWSQLETRHAPVDAEFSRAVFISQIGDLDFRVDLVPV